MITKQFKKKIRDLLYKEGIIKNFREVDINLKEYFDKRINKVESKIKQPDPLDEIFITKREMKLRKELKEQISINEHIRNIYKRDLKREMKS